MFLRSEVINPYFGDRVAGVREPPRTVCLQPSGKRPDSGGGGHRRRRVRRSFAKMGMKRLASADSW